MKQNTSHCSRVKQEKWQSALLLPSQLNKNVSVMAKHMKWFLFLHCMCCHCYVGWKSGFSFSFSVILSEIVSCLTCTKWVLWMAWCRCIGRAINGECSRQVSGSGAVYSSGLQHAEGSCHAVWKSYATTSCEDNAGFSASFCEYTPCHTHELLGTITFCRASDSAYCYMFICTQ